MRRALGCCGAGLLAASLLLGAAGCSDGEATARNAMQALAKNLSKDARFSVARTRLHKQLGILYYFHVVIVPKGGQGRLHCEAEIRTQWKNCEINLFAWGKNPGSKCADIGGRYYVQNSDGKITRPSARPAP